MFKNQEGEMIEKETETIIGPSVKVEGDFHGEGKIVVEGQVIGTLKTNQDLHIGTNAKVKADVEAANVLVAGEIIGDLYVKEKVELKSSAKVTGDITTKVISIEAGATLSGKCDCNQNSTAVDTKETTSKPKSQSDKASKPEVL